MQYRKALGYVTILLVVGVLAAPTSFALSEIRDALNESTIPEHEHGSPDALTTCSTHTSHIRYVGKPTSAALLSAKVARPVAKREEDALWEARYAIYQGLISQGSMPLWNSDEGYLESPEGMPICLLHGRNDVLNNVFLIRYVGALHPEVPPIIVAAAIAEQASDVERVFGVDLLERAVLGVPGKEDMSIGIAQLRPTEVISLGMGTVDLFDPEMAVRGMYAKLRVADARIDLLQSSAAPLDPTERYMLLSLAQNHVGSVDAYFAVDGDWDRLLATSNYARVMRYYLVHLDWLVENGWELPPEIDLDRWRRLVFSAPEEPEPPELGSRTR